MKVLIAGGSGFIGSHLTAALVRDGCEVVVLTRAQSHAGSGVRYVNWDAKSPDGAWASELSGSVAVVILAGSSIGSGRWTRRRMAELVASRVAPTSALVGAIERTPADRRPAVLSNAAGIDYYGNRPDHKVVAADGPVGDSFLARHGALWGAAARKDQTPGGLCPRSLRPEL